MPYLFCTITRNSFRSQNLLAIVLAHNLLPYYSGVIGRSFVNAMWPCFTGASNVA